MNGIEMMRRLSPFRPWSPRTRGFLVSVSVALSASIASVSPTAAQSDGVRGSWHAREYVLAGGEAHTVQGQIHFTESDWLVLFFVMDGETPARGSAEGGRYTLRDGDLTFEHLHHLSVGEALSGLAASPLRMETRRADGALEPARVEVDDDVLTLFFPSGNRMMFVRGSAP